MGRADERPGPIDRDPRLPNGGSVATPVAAHSSGGFVLLSATAITKNEQLASAIFRLAVPRMSSFT
jgi:hypothetical protein